MREAPLVHERLDAGIEAAASTIARTSSSTSPVLSLEDDVGGSVLHAQPRVGARVLVVGDDADEVVVGGRSLGADSPADGGGVGLDGAQELLHRADPTKPLI